MRTIPTCASGPAVVLEPRTCCRCGVEFGAIGREYKCRTCRAPVVRPAREHSSALSHREAQIVALVEQAKSNKEIAFDLRLTVGTVKEYLVHIFRKTGSANRTALARWSMLRRAA